MIKNKAQNTQMVNGEQDMLALGIALSLTLQKGDVIYLYGDLGTGKTTLTKGILQGLGFSGRVKSPTYTLVESYPIEDITLQHFDLYRLSDPEELEWIGIRDYFSSDTISLIEWPQKGRGFLPKPTKEIYLDYADHGRKVTW